MKKLILSVAVALISFASTMAQNVPTYVSTSGLIGYWAFTGNAHDYSIKGNNGVVNGAVLVPNRFGNTDRAYQFNAGQTIVVPDSAYLDGMATGLTISFWTKVPAPTGGPNFLISKMTHCLTYGDDAYAISVLPNGKIYVQFADAFGIDKYQTSSIAIADNKWHHVVLVWSNPQTIIYIDGVADLGGSYTSFNGPITPSQDPLIFGHGNLSNCTGLLSYGESLDDICIYNRAIGQSGVDSLFASCIGAPTATLSALGNTTLCAGGDVLLKCTTGYGYKYQWKKNNTNISGATSSTYNASNGGSYKCLVTTPCGTAISSAIVVTLNANAVVTLSASGSTSFCQGDSVTLNASNPGANYSFQWYRNDASLTGATALSYKAKQEGTYKLVSKNNTTGCSRISSGIPTTTLTCALANPNPNQVSRSIENKSTVMNTIKLYPNPNSGSFTFEYAGLREDETGTATIQLYNGVGQKVYELTIDVQNGRVSKELNLNGSVKSGIYLLKMEINNQVYDSKVMID